ncbi:MAG: winged helix-turn-helix transcriptional regulator [Firmicutes bacterium]|nr:winged helix-turn-helix transcriptional regulator [Bacillota bacterium]
MDPLEQVIRVLQALGQDTRLKILKVLSINSFCVCELEEIFGISQPAISHHLGILKDAGLVESSREGQWVFYKADKEGLEESWHMLDQFLSAPIQDLPGMSEIVEKVREVERNPRTLCKRAN